MLEPHGHQEQVRSREQEEIVDLPPTDTQRWVWRRKAQLVKAVRMGHLSFDEACRRYNILPEELSSWERTVAQHGERALRVTRLQEVGQRKVRSRRRESG